MKEKIKKLLIQISKFGVVGILCTVFEYVLYLVMTDALSLDVYFSQAVSFSASTVLNYLLSMKFVFVRDAEKRSRAAEFILFAVLSVVGLGLSEAVLLLFTKVFRLDDLLGKLFATGTVMVFNFVTRKLLLEKRESRDADNADKESRDGDAEGPERR